MAEVVVSAPGKVLLTGGYLILERPNAGIVLSTTARFYAIVRPLYEAIDPNSWAWAWTDVKLSSPQLSRETTYKLSLKNSRLQCTSSRDSSNPFVEQAVQYSVAAAHSIYGKGKKDGLHKLLLQGLDITVLGCNDFYSYRNQIEARGLPLAPDVLALIPPFSSITFNREGSSGTIAGEKCKPEVAKTGLGSSAAMTTAVVAAVLHYLGVVNLSFTAKNLHETLSSSDLDLVHVVAQTAHCIAQGKVGSGFDVSAAVYGSQHYICFSPAVLSSAQARFLAEISVGEIPSPKSPLRCDASPLDSKKKRKREIETHQIQPPITVAVKGQPLEVVITRILEEKWDHEKIKFSLPPLMTLLLGEPGTGGSSTPSMVGAVKQWQKSDPQKSLETWRRLAEANSLLEMQLKALGTFAHEKLEAYKLVIGNCSSHRYEKWLEQAVDPYQEAVIKSLVGARDAMLEIRFHMQQMGQAVGIPIEPESQTRLLDATMNMEGVLLAGVPGAGGFDAIFAVTLGDSSSNVMKAWSSLSVLPMLVREDPRGVCLESSDPRANEISSSISSMHI